MFATFCVVYLMVLVVELMLVGVGVLVAAGTDQGPLSWYGCWCLMDLTCKGAAVLLEALAALL